MEICTFVHYNKIQIMSVVVNNVSRFYGDQKALDNISFAIPKGKVVGLLGPNGAGKSTLMKILAGFIPPSLGEAFICDFNVVEQPLQSKRMVGYLPEHNPLYLDLYVKEYLMFMGQIRGLGKSVENRVDEIIGLTGIVPEKHKKLGQLSKGFRQRVGLAQAILHDPSVLILDEPTSGFDPNQVLEIRRLITDLGCEHTVLLSTHIMQEVEAMCDHVIIINHGTIIADAPKEELCATGSLEEVFHRLTKEIKPEN